MRIVAIADTHLFHHHLSVPDGDVLVHAGDMCRGGDLPELTEAAAYIASLPHRHKVIVAGNHDWSFFDDATNARALFAGVGIHYLEDSGVAIDGVTFWGSPWQPEFNAWAFNLPRGPKLAEKWSLIPERTDVLVTHCPPYGIGDRCSMGGRDGCVDLLARALHVRPRLHLFGHIHEDGGAFERDGIHFVNVTTWECERAPSVIDFDQANRAITLQMIPPRTTR